MSKNESHQNRSHKKQDIRLTNISAGRQLSDLVRTSLGPRGMDKMIQDDKGQILISNDGATILKKLQVVHPVAKMLVEISKAQDIEAGDGTTSVVIIAGELLKICEKLLNQDIHPLKISNGFNKALEICLQYLDQLSIEIDTSNKQELMHIVNTCLSSKVVNSYSKVISPLAIDIMHYHNTQNLNQIKVIKKLGNTIDESKIVNGLIMNKKIATNIKKVENSRIILIQFCISSPKTDIENNIEIQEYQSMDRLLKEERKYVMNIVKQIVKHNVNVVLIQKSILKESLSELGIHFLNKKGIMCIDNIERDDVPYICEQLKLIPISNIDQIQEDKIGKCDLVQLEILEDGQNYIKFECDTKTVLLRGSNQLLLDEAERSFHDALCVIRSLFKKNQILSGGGSTEIELAQFLLNQSWNMTGIDQLVIREFSKALHIIPYTLAENAGLNSIEIITELKKLHQNGFKFAGISIKNNSVSNNLIEEKIMQPIIVTQSALNLATEVVKMILKIDDFVLTAR